MAISPQLPDAWRSSTRRAGPAAAVNVPSNRVGYADTFIVDDIWNEVMPSHSSNITGYDDFYGRSLNTTQRIRPLPVAGNRTFSVGYGAGGGGGVSNADNGFIVARGNDGVMRWPDEVTWTNPIEPSKSQVNTKSSTESDYKVDIDSLKRDLNLSVNLVQVGNKLEIKVSLSDRNGSEYSFDSDFVELDI